LYFFEGVRTVQLTDFVQSLRRHLESRLNACVPSSFSAAERMQLCLKILVNFEAAVTDILLEEWPNLELSIDPATPAEIPLVPSDLEDDMEEDSFSATPPEIQHVPSDLEDDMEEGSLPVFEELEVVWPEAEPPPLHEDDSLQEV
jgi:hypothetical protein